jgi:hypothetical protein
MPCIVRRADVRAYSRAYEPGGSISRDEATERKPGRASYGPESNTFDIKPPLATRHTSDCERRRHGGASYSIELPAPRPNRISAQRNARPFLWRGNPLGFVYRQGSAQNRESNGKYSKINHVRNVAVGVADCSRTRSFPRRTFTPAIPKQRPKNLIQSPRYKLVRPI